LRSWNNNTDKKKGFLLIGEITSLHGLKGNLKIHSYAESIDVFKPKDLVLVQNADGSEQSYAIQSAKPHHRAVILSLEGIDSRSAAEALIGSVIYIEKRLLTQPDDGSYYWFDIIGLSVYTINKQYVGKVSSIIPTGANDVYVVTNPDINTKNEVLIPAVDTVVLSIDLKKKKMIIDLPEGL
jgi:16S rRNA processing protein RimM